LTNFLPNPVIQESVRKAAAAAYEKAVDIAEDLADG
jgi:hypothetical protein